MQDADGTTAGPRGRGGSQDEALSTDPARQRTGTREEPAAEPAAEPAPAEPQESPESQEPKAPKKPKKKKKKSRPKQGKKAPAKAKNAKPREKRPTLAEFFGSMERGCAYIGMQLLREYYAIRRGIGHVYGRVRARVPILWRSLRFKVVRRTEHFADEVLFPYRILHDETAELAAAHQAERFARHQHFIGVHMTEFPR